MAIKNIVGSRSHVSYLDGMRGLASLYVLIFHIQRFNHYGYGLPPLIYELLCWTKFGHAAVAVFIVLSGYLLMLPIAKTGEDSIPGGTWPYIKRRARRILPPYYAALFVAALISYIHAHHHGQGIDQAALLSHIFLVHDLNSNWVWAFDAPMWSVAVEWQIYFFLPFVLLPLRKLAGMPAVIMVAFTIGLLPHFVLSQSRNLDWACPWYLGLFTLGMLGACINSQVSKLKRIESVSSNVWFSIFCVCMFAVAIIYNWLGDKRDAYQFAVDPLLGVCSMTLIVGITKSMAETKKSSFGLMMRVVFESRVAQILGSFSYSLYLTNWIILDFAESIVEKHIHTIVSSLTLNYLVVFPVTLVLTYGFYLFFERPWLSKSKKLISALEQKGALPAITELPDPTEMSALETSVAK